MLPDTPKTWRPICVSAGALAFSPFTSVRNLRAERRPANNAIIRLLQGEKESAINIAHIAVSPKWVNRIGVMRTILITPL